MKRHISWIIFFSMIFSMLFFSGCGPRLLPPVIQENLDGGEGWNSYEKNSQAEGSSPYGEASSGEVSSEENSSNASVPVNSAAEQDTFEYNKYLGEWIDVARVDAWDVGYRGGDILEIRSIEKNVEGKYEIAFSLTTLSAAPQNRVASVEGKCVFENGKGVYEFSDDGWGNRGVLIIRLTATGISLEVSLEEEGSSGWGVSGASGEYYAAGSEISYGVGPTNKQVVVVETVNSTATVTLKQWNNGDWEILHKTSGTVGKQGITLTPSETSTATPEGVFDLGFAFALQQPETRLDFRAVTENTYWIDDPNSKFYNMWKEGTSGKDWSSAEALYSQFKTGNMRYCIVMEFNGDGITSDNVRPGEGSVIFFCGRAGDITATNGDVYVKEKDMKKMLSYMDSAYYPVIEIRQKEA